MLKKKIIYFLETVLDTLLDFVIPYKFCASKNITKVPKWVPFHYVFNQKIQRLQIVDVLRKAGIQNPTKLEVWWSRGLNNFGDELLPYLMAHIAGIECRFSHAKKFISIGSIIRFANDNTVVWGSGIIRKEESMEASPRCLAVRGPLTRQKLLSSNIDCPEIYGDPAMLFPLFYSPKISKTEAKALVVPHFKHTSIIQHHAGYEYLSLHGHSCQDIECIVDSIASAKSVITSSLHAFIFCVAYGVPVTVFKLDKQGIGGDNIKFDDFCSGVGLEPIEIHTLNDEDKQDHDRLIKAAQIYTPQWSAKPLLESLAAVYPTATLLEFIQKTS